MQLKKVLFKILQFFYSIYSFVCISTKKKNISKSDICKTTLSNYVTKARKLFVVEHFALDIFNRVINIIDKLYKSCCIGEVLKQNIELNFTKK